MSSRAMILVGSGADLEILSALAERVLAESSESHSLSVPVVSWSALAETPPPDVDLAIFALMPGPDRALAHALATGAPPLPEALQQWASGARWILDRHRRDPRRHRMIDRNDAAAAPDAFLEQFSKWAGLQREALIDIAHPATVPADAVLQQLCGDALRLSPHELALQQELAVCCLPLAAQQTRPATADPWRAIAVHWEGLRAAAETEVTRDMALRQTEQLALQLQASRELASAASEQALQAIAELNGVHAHMRAIDKRRQEAESARDSLSAKAEALRLQLAAANRAADSARHIAASTQRDLACTEQAAQTVRAALDLERRARAAAGVGRAWAAATAAELNVVAMHDAAPHRHLELRVSELVVAGHHVDQCRLRLVEHGGHAGIAIFDAGESLRPIRAWKPSGAEDGIDYMLLVPEDEVGSTSLNRFGQSDWLMLDGIVRLLAWHLVEQASPQVSLRWRSVAATLARQLAAWPCRLRYDALLAEPVPTREGSKRVTLENAAFGELAIGRIELSWSDPTGRQPTVTWQLGNDSIAPPLGCWPIGDDGVPAAAFVLPVGAAAQPRVKRARWHRMQAQEREMLLGLLDTLTAASSFIGETDPKAVDALSRSARSLQREARSLVATQRRRSRLRDWLRRASGRSETLPKTSVI